MEKVGEKRAKWSLIQGRAMVEEGGMKASSLLFLGGLFLFSFLFLLLVTSYCSDLLRRRSKDAQREIEISA